MNPQIDAGAVSRMNPDDDGDAAMIEKIFGFSALADRLTAALKNLMSGQAHKVGNEDLMLLFLQELNENPWPADDFELAPAAARAALDVINAAGAGKTLDAEALDDAPLSHGQKLSIAAAHEIMSRPRREKSGQLTEPHQMFNLLKRHAGKSEFVLCCLLHQDGSLRSVRKLHDGTEQGRPHLVGAGDVYTAAAGGMAANIIIAHHLPSGLRSPQKLRPDPAQLRNIDEIARLGKAIGIRLRDYLYFCSGSFVSVHGRHDSPL